MLQKNDERSETRWTELLNIVFRAEKGGYREEKKKKKKSVDATVFSVYLIFIYNMQLHIH